MVALCGRREPHVAMPLIAVKLMVMTLKVAARAQAEVLLSVVAAAETNDENFFRRMMCCRGAVARGHGFVIMTSGHTARRGVDLDRYQHASSRSCENMRGALQWHRQYPNVNRTCIRAHNAHIRARVMNSTESRSRLLMTTAPSCTLGDIFGAPSCGARFSGMT